MTKPDPGKHPFDDLPRIEIDESDDSPFARILRTATFAADAWIFSPDGPYVIEDMTGATRTRGTLRYALLHLLELGLIDIDTDRVEQLQWTPTDRESCRPVGQPIKPWPRPVGM